jgi:hypothetical protein
MLALIRAVIVDRTARSIENWKIKKLTDTSNYFSYIRNNIAQHFKM